MSFGNDIVNVIKIIVQLGNVRLEEWLGINGLSIFVGVLCEDIYLMQK